LKLVTENCYSFQVRQTASTNHISDFVGDISIVSTVAEQQIPEDEYSIIEIAVICSQQQMFDG
jgi:hypothetical protein